MMQRERGFTLVEAIVVMVITAILAGVAVLFIRRPVQSYVDTAARADMADVAEIALRRMARELHGAVPNSVRLSIVGNTSLLEFIPSKAGGRYLAEDDGADPAIYPPLRFTSPSTQFYIVTPLPTGQAAIVPGDSIIVYNLGSGFAGTDAYAASAPNNALVQSVGGKNMKVVTLNANTFATGATASPGKRFTVAAQPVTFACVSNPAGNGTLTRFWNYGFRPNQLAPDAITPAPPQLGTALMAANVLGCQFSVQQMANQNTALIGLAIALARPSPGSGANGLETATLAQQIHVDNTP
jgi:MSHA biogenesis protein MshO